ncbi:hypothetical protein DQ04_16451030 [Trypanosoma grayi]|uniref:hypothetical protein n=1 Tax=Trypanosoma grayi TaxID=71804 RepID=UPI0004F4015A|nr:hypothetical protein DQ04_16451030 [Trypanosoma grayi]KEG06027.1 hypothetical protein DQ04_16451030 [Trypanosoma grayi]
MKKGNAHSDALVGEAGLIDRVLRDQGLHATWGYAALANNPADGISRGAKVLPTDIAKGGAGGGLRALSAPPFRQWDYKL